MPKTETAVDSITCPGCSEVIPISETIYHQVAERAERELKAKSVRQERALAEREKQIQTREERVRPAGSGAGQSRNRRAEGQGRTAGPAIGCFGA